LTIMSELMTGNGKDVIFKLESLMYVVLSRAEKHTLYGRLVGTTECIAL
jgi:hypothetical protein